MTRQYRFQTEDASPELASLPTVAIRLQKRGFTHLGPRHSGGDIFADTTPEEWAFLRLELQRRSQLYLVGPPPANSINWPRGTFNLVA
jgi:hypothetical protein